MKTPAKPKRAEGKAPSALLISSLFLLAVGKIEGHAALDDIELELCVERAAVLPFESLDEPCLMLIEKRLRLLVGELLMRDLPEEAKAAAGN